MGVLGFATRACVALGMLALAVPVAADPYHLPEKPQAASRAPIGEALGAPPPSPGQPLDLTALSTPMASPPSAKAGSELHGTQSMYNHDDRSTFTHDPATAQPPFSHPGPITVEVPEGLVLNGRGFSVEQGGP
jgi:hypothetical protein